MCLFIRFNNKVKSIAAMCLSLALLAGCGSGFQALDSSAETPQNLQNPSQLRPTGPRNTMAKTFIDSERSTPALWEGRVTGSAEWTSAVTQALRSYGGRMLATNPEDMASFCPKYATLTLTEDRISVWTRLISAMAFEESGLRPRAHYVEAVRFGNHSNVSLGLLQLTKDSGNAYGCEFKSDEDVLDPKQNLRCGVIILARWVVHDNRVAGIGPGRWKGGAEYWSVLKSDLTVRKIKIWTRGLPLCG